MLAPVVGVILLPLLIYWSDSWGRRLSNTPKHTPGRDLHFQLRHQHATTTRGGIVFSDVSQKHISLSSLNGHTLHAKPIKTFRPSSLAAYRHAQSRSWYSSQSEPLRWEEDEVPAPDVENRETLLELAKMTYDAYLDHNDTNWYDLDGKWNVTYPVGWEPDADGFRGYVFAVEDNSTIVLSIKGTSAAVFGGAGPTAKKDKFNDNLLFSCCCAYVDYSWSWSTVCDCARGGWTCDQNCLEKALIEESLFYPVGMNLYNNLSYMYPNSNIWIVGHSLGGALSSMVGTTFGAPAVAFEAPGDRLASSRLHLPSPPSTQHVVHVYHTADPIAMGTCNGVLSSCSLGGYALETRCHIGRSVVYDTISNLSWAADIRTHTIATVIERILSEPWAPSVEVGREVPEPIVEDDCVECYSWDFGDYPKKKEGLNPS